MEDQGGLDPEAGTQETEEEGGFELCFPTQAPATSLGTGLTGPPSQHHHGAFNARSELNPEDKALPTTQRHPSIPLTPIKNTPPSPFCHPHSPL